MIFLLFDWTEVTNETNNDLTELTDEEFYKIVKETNGFVLRANEFEDYFNSERINTATDQIRIIDEETFIDLLLS